MSGAKYIAGAQYEEVNGALKYDPDLFRTRFLTSGEIPSHLVCDQVSWIAQVARGVEAPPGISQLADWYNKQNALKQLDAKNVNDLKPGATLFFVQYRNENPRAATNDIINEVHFDPALSPNYPPDDPQHPISYPWVFHAATVIEVSKEKGLITTFETGATGDDPSDKNRQSFAGRKQRTVQQLLHGEPYYEFVYFGYVNPGTPKKFLHERLLEYQANRYQVDEGRRWRREHSKGENSGTGDRPQVLTNPPTYRERPSRTEPDF